jgi:hypothetical protein
MKGRGRDEWWIMGRGKGGKKGKETGIRGAA